MVLPGANSVFYGTACNKETVFFEGLKRLWPVAVVALAVLEKSAEILSSLGQSILEYKNAADKALEDYNSSLDQSGEKVDNYRGRIENLNTTLDHLNTILELTGRSKDFDAIGEILEGQI